MPCLTVCATAPTLAHEYIFLLSKNARYFYDGDAIAPALQPSAFHTK